VLIQGWYGIVTQTAPYLLYASHSMRRFPGHEHPCEVECK